MRVLVTGGSGFIGSHVVDKLKNRGVTVRIFDMLPPSHRTDIEHYHGSIMDLEALHMSMNKVDAVIHLAAIADVRDVLENPHHAEAINVRGTINVLEAMRRSGVTRLVYGSTTWVYSDAEHNKVDEDTPLKAPAHFYSATKIAGEYYCRSYTELYGLESTVLRFGIPYGPRARPGAVVPSFVKQALNNLPITIAGDGSQYRKFVFVEDLAEGIVLALKPAAKNQIYNLDGAEKVTILEIAETVKSILGNVNIEFGPSRPGDYSGKEVSSDKALRELGWKARTPFADGVRKYIEWYKNELQFLANRWQSVDTDIV